MTNENLINVLNADSNYECSGMEEGMISWKGVGLYEGVEIIYDHESWDLVFFRGSSTELDASDCHSNLYI